MQADALNIVFVIDKFDVGGAQRQLIAVANRIAARSIGKVLVICLQRLGPLASELSPHIRVLSLGLRRIYGLGALRALASTRAILRQNDCRLIHGFLPSANIFGAALHTITGIPAIASRRDIGIYPGKLWAGLEEQVAYRLVDRVACVSEEVRDILLRRVRGLGRKTLVIPNGIDIAAADQLAQQSQAEIPSGDYVVCVGNIKPVKGYDFLIDAAPEVNGKFVIVGGGPDLARMREEVLRRRLEQRVEFLGHRDAADVARIVRHAAFAAHPSHTEGMSNAILEFMVQQRAVLARQLPGNAEIVTDGETGLLFRDRTEFITAANRLLSSPELRRRMGDAGRARIESHFGLDAVVSSYVKLYREICAARTYAGVSTT